MAQLKDLAEDKTIKLLIFSDSGNGKTCFANSFPGKIYNFDFDNKISSAANFYTGTEQLNEIEYDSYAPTKKDDIGPMERFIKKINEFDERRSDFPFKTIVVDSLTTFSDEALKYIMKINPGIKRMETKGAATASMQDYGVARTFFKQVIMGVLSLPCNVIFTAHIATDKDENTGEILRTPLIAGKLKNELPIYFAEVYRAYVETDAKGVRNYMAQTQSDSKFNCRSQIKGLPPKIPLKYEQLIMKR